MTGFLFCIVLPILPGIGLQRLKKNRDTVTLTECYMTGILACFLLGEAASCMTIRLNGEFSFYGRLLAGLMAGCGLLSLLAGRSVIKGLLCRIRTELSAGKGKNRYWKRRLVETVILTVLLAMQFAGYFLYTPDTGADTMTEMISTVKLTDTVFWHDPVTGKPLANGMYPLYKLVSLPLLYGSVYGVCGISLQRFLYIAVPFWLIAVNFVILRGWSGLLLGRQKEKRNLFLIFASLLTVMGDADPASYAYALLHNGWRGTAAAGVILLAGAYILFEMLAEKEWLYGIVGLVMTLCGLLSACPLLLPDAASFTVGGIQWGMLLISILGLYLVRERTKKRWKRPEVFFLGACLAAGAFPGSPFAALGISFALTAMWGVAEEWKKGGVMFAGLLIMICMTGTVLPYQADIPKRWHIPESDREIQDKIAELAKTYEGEVILAAPEHVMEQARLSDGRIVLPYGKDLWHPGCNREVRSIYPYGEEEMILYEQMKTDYNQPDTVAALAVDMKCDILVLRERMSEDAMRQYGWRETEKITGYAVYISAVK